MSKPPPRVSIIIPAYGHGSLILETLDSVFTQTFTDHEIIVVNDGSPDDTAERLVPMAEAGRVRYFEQPNAGQAAARNRGLAEARGEMVAFLDDDDLWPADKLEWQTAWLDAHLDFILVAGSYADIDATGKLLARVPIAEGRVTFERLLSGTHFRSPGQTLIRAEPLRAAGGFDPRIWGGDDYELWLRLCQRGDFAAVSKLALYYRCHTTNASRYAEKMYWNLVDVGALHLRRLPPEIRPQITREHYRFVYDYAVRNVFRAWFRPPSLRKRASASSFAAKSGAKFLLSVLSTPPLRYLFFQHISAIFVHHFLAIARCCRNKKS